VTDGQTDRQNYDYQDRASIAASRGKKKERQKDKPNSGKLGIRRDHPRRRIEMKFCVVGRLQMVVLTSKVRIASKSVKRFRSCGGRNLPIPIDLTIGLYNSLYYRASRDNLM